MKDKLQADEERYVKRNRLKRRWYKFLVVMASVVVFCTTYALILPAITMEQTEENIDPETTEEELIVQEVTETAAETVLTLSEETAETPQGSETPLDVKNYISKEGTKLYYKLPGTSDWVELTAETKDLPGNARFKLQISFEKVPISDLKAAGYQMTYEMPELLRKIEVLATITSGGQNAGTMEVSGQTVVLKFDPEWIEKQGEENLNGSFYAEAEADLSKIPGEGNGTITVGDLTFQLNFTKDVIAQYGDISLEKTLVELEETEDGNYLKYTLKVTAGEDGCPDVSVKDSFTKNLQYVKNYELPENSGASVGEDGTMTWTIGDMKAGEEKTLTYRVKLAENYLGVKAKNPVENTAQLYAKEYLRDTKTADFTPKAGVTMSKVAGTYQEDESGGGIITYTVWVKAKDDNNYTLKNVTLWDSLDGTVSGGNKTEDALLPYLSYGTDFQLYQGGNDKQNGSTGLTKITGGPAELGEDEKSFQYNVGDLKPGEGKTLVYTVKVGEGIYTQKNETTLTIANRVSALTDPNVTSADGGGQRLENYNASKNLAGKKWDRKLVGAATGEDKTIEAGENSFTVPKGSYEYQVVVNETGDWDVSGAVFSDALTGPMHYVGYAKVDVYEITNGTTYKTDSEAAAALEKLTPTETKWVEIDAAKKFSFSPTGIGLSEGSYAYRVTYYAVPESLSDISTVDVTNKFELTGTVIGTGNVGYTMGSASSSVAVRLEGTNHFGVSKQFWYYDTEASGAGKGEFYWLIRMNGANIPSGTMIKDAITDGNHKIGKAVTAFIWKNTGDFSKYSSLADLQKDAEYKEFTAYTASENAEVTLTENVTLSGDQGLYFVVTTYPTSVPANKGNHQKYINAVYTKDPGESTSWVKQSEDFHYIVGGGNVYKTLAEVFQVKVGTTAADTTIIHMQGNETTILQNDYLMNAGSGIYAAWRVRINQTSALEGNYRIEEEIPSGMELIYVQRYSTASKKDYKFQEIKGLSEEWTEVRQDFTFQDANPTEAIFYKKGQSVIWEVGPFTADPTEQPQTAYAEYLVVCKLTDEELLLDAGTKDGKDYVNHVSLKDSSGTLIGSDTDTVHLTAQTFSKVGTHEEEDGNRYPFKITVNEWGTDLVAGTDEIKIIDEMSELLIPDPTSVKVVNTDTGTAVSFKTAVEGHKLILTVPDDQPLTITYEATVNAAPNQKVEISNKAHWEGYESPETGQVKEESFSYPAGAEVGTSTAAKVIVLKLDQYDNAKTLSGAGFSLTEMVVDEEGNLTKTEKTPVSKTTTSDGKVTFEDLSYNTVYCLEETTAPTGYVLDATPHYFAVAKKIDTGYQSFPDSVTVWYSSAEYSYTAYNHKGEIQVEKSFQNADGTDLTAKLNGTYTFGLYDNADGNGEPLQTAKLIVSKGTVTPADGKTKFTNLDFGKNYYVFELDDTGSVLKDKGTVGGVPYQVIYENEDGVTLTDDKPSAEVSVINRINYTELPETGGMGITSYRLGGTAMIGFAMTSFIYRKKKGNKRNESNEKI